MITRDVEAPLRGSGAGLWRDWNPCAQRDQRLWLECSGKGAALRKPQGGERGRIAI